MLLSRYLMLLSIDPSKMSDVNCTVTGWRGRTFQCQIVSRFRNCAQRRNGRHGCGTDFRGNAFRRSRRFRRTGTPTWEHEFKKKKINQSNKNNYTKLARYRNRCKCRSKDPAEGWPRQPNEASNFPARPQWLRRGVACPDWDRSKGMRYGRKARGNWDKTFRGTQSDWDQSHLIAANNPDPLQLDR